MSWRIALSDLNYDGEEEAAVVRVIRSRWLSMGPETEAFEAEAAQYLNVRHAIAVANCTCALELAWAACARHQAELADPAATSAAPPRNQVLVPDITFVATANSALLTGHCPTLLDIQSPALPGLSQRAAAAALAADAAADGGPRIGAIGLVHYAGFDAQAEAFRRLAGHYGCWLIEDAAHAIGGHTRSGVPLGAIGHVGTYSFFANKNLSTGEGGLLATNDDALAAQARLLRSHGMTSLTWQRHTNSALRGYDVLVPGHNYRCTELMAALARCQLQKLGAGNARRRELWRAYQAAIAASPVLAAKCRLPFGDDPATIDAAACHILPLLFRAPVDKRRGEAALREAGIQTSHHYPPVHRLTAYHANGSDAELPNACAFSDTELTLPLHPGLKEIEVEEICATLAAALA